MHACALACAPCHCPCAPACQRWVHRAQTTPRPHAGQCLCSHLAPWHAERMAVQAEVDALRAEQPEAVKAAAVAALLRGAAAHHAGCLPAWKSLLERLFQRGVFVRVCAGRVPAAAGVCGQLLELCCCRPPPPLQAFSSWCSRQRPWRRASTCPLAPRGSRAWRGAATAASARCNTTRCCRWQAAPGGAATTRAATAWCCRASGRTPTLRGPSSKRGQSRCARRRAAARAVTCPAARTQRWRQRAAPFVLRARSAPP